MKFAIWIFAVILLFAACKKKASSVEQPILFGDGNMLLMDATGYFSFGKYYGMCGGPNCARFYKISNGSVYPDNMVQFRKPLLFAGVPLSSPNAWVAASAVLYNFPQEMTNQPDTAVGCPDCHDQGAYYIEYKASSTAPVKYWSVDPDTAYLSNAIRAYLSRIDTALAHL
ncbi:hypothetical protein [Taibaiella soli]|uniref:Cytochrome c domain-containing protein n=1 Tax=Taibaiella soli TaxID=1649169 RepID=A0A2W2APR1_9BACT|nr:hypothetical protein [Taibaiella soli]PZF74390.1 hypothetical protein DN068_02080 [Taibaiella soli]